MISKWLCGIVVSIALLAGSFYYDNSAPIYTGVTEEGVYYEVFEDSNGFADLLDSADFRRVTIRVEYAGKVIPPRTMKHSETYRGVLYSGTLSLSDIKEFNGKTEATYKGKLYKET